MSDFTFVRTCLSNVFVNPRMTLTICKVLERVWEKSCISQEGSSCQADRFFSFFSLTDKKINWFVRNSFLDWMGFHFVFCKISLPLSVDRTTNCPLKRNLLICFRPQDSLSRNLQRYIHNVDPPKIIAWDVTSFAFWGYLRFWKCSQWLLGTHFLSDLILDQQIKSCDIILYQKVIALQLSIFFAAREWFRLFLLTSLSKPLLWLCLISFQQNVVYRIASVDV